MGIGKKLSCELKNQNMKVSELSKKSGISSQTLYAIIKRDSERVNIETLQKISQTLNVPITTFIDNSPLDIISNDFVNSMKELSNRAKSLSNNENNNAGYIDDETLKLLYSSELCLSILMLSLGYALIDDKNDTEIKYIIKNNTAYTIYEDDIEEIWDKLLDYLQFILFNLTSDGTLEEIDLKDIPF